MSSETSSKSKEKSLFVCVKDTHLITHDGYVQLGIIYHSLEEHLRLNPHVEWKVVYWVPDIFTKRYKRVNFQHHERVSGPKGVLESMQAQSRLDRSV